MGNIRRRKYQAKLTIAFCIPLFQQLTGMNVFMFYAPILFKTVGFRSNASLMSTVIAGFVNCIATSVSIVIVDKVGSRFLFLEGGLQILLMQAGSLVACICTYKARFASSWGPLGWLVPS
ncbi:hypothetical protein CRG98_033263 [Punica granatum]|uniref:Major facilitator superfamily (MFS) profile domain-containing protein n=1 Tax=Punica granatum TaxID=22663 RepID=A0A2I0IQV8_PUNGR|nr:hypothetical protein CRG98_033263 [Punica granatum]